MNTMPTHAEVLENGATADEFGIPDRGDLADKVALAVQADIDDKNDRDAHIIAEDIIEDAEMAGCFLLDDERDPMLEAFVQSVAQDRLSIVEASENLDKALLRHFERQGEEYE